MSHKIEFAFFKLLQWVLMLMPFRSVQRLGAGFGLAGYYLIASRRATALDNLRHAFPDLPPSELRAIAKRTFMNYGTTLMEFFWIPALKEPMLDEIYDSSQFSVMSEAVARGKGGVFLTGHMGNWELLALASSRYAKTNFTIIVQAQSNKYFDDEINRGRTKFGNRVVPMGISIREILRTLQQGGMVGMAGDQSGAKEAVYVDFFGRSTATHQGPAVFALKCGVPLILALSFRRPDGSFDVEIQEIPVSDLQEYNDANVLELTSRHTAALEAAIRRQPDQWLWMHRRWKNTWESVQKELAEAQRA
jgi:KDO2-lipid IV(A) lauroyltransferase